MHIEDLSTNAYFAQGEDVRAIGWLGAGHAFPRGPVPGGFLSALKACVPGAYQPFLYMGFHHCSLCPDGNGPRSNTNLLIPTPKVLFAAPAMILHYVLDHEYQPPTVFTAAVTACPPQESPQYLAMIRKFEHSWARRQ